MKDLLTFIAKMLVDNADEVSVVERETETEIILELRVAKEDMGKVIGKQGRIAKAILQEYPTAQSVRLRLLKENPPMGADCKGAGVEIFIERETQNNN